MSPHSITKQRNTLHKESEEQKEQQCRAPSLTSCPSRDTHRDNLRNPCPTLLSVGVFRGSKHPVINRRDTENDSLKTSREADEESEEEKEQQCLAPSLTSRPSRDTLRRLPPLKLFLNPTDSAPRYPAWPLHACRFASCLHPHDPTNPAPSEYPSPAPVEG